MTTPQVFVSKPTTVHASEPVTPANREEVVDWVRNWGGHGSLTPTGYEVMIMLATDQGTKDVPEGWRVVWDTANFWPVSPEHFDARWEELPDASGTEAGGAPVLDQPPS